MRRIAFPAAIALLAASVGLWFFTRGGPAPAPVEPPAAAFPAPDVEVNDGAEVFRKAFWKQPFPSDRIIHAIRREWLDEEAVSRWDWFLEVEPSPEIIRHLREDNAFGLIRAASAEIPAEAPAWFTRETAGSQIFTSAGGGMQLIFTAGDTRLFANGSGGGFRRGVPEPAAPQLESNPTGRFPDSRPPVPEKP